MVKLANESGRFIDSVVVAIHDITGELRRVIGHWPGGERVRYQRDGMITTLGAPFGRSLATAPWRAGYCIGFGRNFNIACYSATGGLLRVIRMAGPLRPVTADDIRAYTDEQLQSRALAYRRAFRRVMDDITFPETFPAFAALKVDAGG